VLASEQNRPGVARKRRRRKTRLGRIDPGRLVFIDETSAILRQAQDKYGAVAGSARPAPAGQVRYGHGKTMTFLAALRCDRIDAPWVLDRPINGESFRVYVERVLVPALAQGAIVVMDNSPPAEGVRRAPLGSHKGKAIRRATGAAGAGLFLLPPL
jgi:hypothetical protein